jgi:hypothetical protein
MFSQLRIREWLAREIETVSYDPNVILLYLDEVVEAAEFLKDNWDEENHGIKAPVDDD